MIKIRKPAIQKFLACLSGLGTAFSLNCAQGADNCIRLPQNYRTESFAKSLCTAGDTTELEVYGVRRNDIRLICTLNRLISLKIFPIDIVTGNQLRELSCLRDLRSLAISGPVRGLQELSLLRSLKSLTIRDNTLTDSEIEHLSSTQPRLQVIELVGRSLTDNTCRALARMSHLQVVRLYDTKVTPAGFAELSKLQLKEVSTPTHNTDSFLCALRTTHSLEMANLVASDVSDRGIRCIAHLKLRQLNLALTMINDRSLALLAPNANLRGLNLTGTKIGDGACTAVASKFRNLTELRLASNAITGLGVNEILANGKLELLDVNHTNVDAAMLRLIDRCPRLRELNVDSTRCDNNIVEHLSHNSRIEVLGMSHTSVSDSAIAKCARLPNLTKLTLVGNPITEKGLKLLLRSKSLRTVYVASGVVSERTRRQFTVRGISLNEI